MIISRILVSLLVALVCRLAAQDVWIDRSSELVGPHTPTAITYAGGRFFLFSAGPEYAHSAFGTASWQTGSLPGASIDFSARGAATDGTHLVVTGTNDSIYTLEVAAPASAPAWQLHRPFGNESLSVNRVRRLNDRFVAGASADTSSANPLEHVWRLLSSADGLNWTEHRIASPQGLIPNISGIVDLAYSAPIGGGAGLWVATVTTADTLLILDEGFTTATRVTAAGMGFARSVVFGNGAFVAACDNGKIYRSTNGSDWAACLLPVAASTLTDVFYDGSRFVAVGGTVPDRSNRATILHSVDGAIWELARELPATFYGLTTVHQADGLWLAAGTSRRLLTSGASSFPPPVFSLDPQDAQAQVGQAVTFSATVANGDGAQLQWLFNGAPLAESSSASGTKTLSLTVTGGLGNAGEYTLQATNIAGTTRSRAARLAVSLSGGGATLHTFATPGIQGGALIEGANPPALVLATGLGERMPAAVFSPTGGLADLSNTRTATVNYTLMGGIAPAGDKIVLGDSYGAAPPLIYDLLMRQGTPLPSPASVLPGKTITAIRPTGLANTGDVVGVINILYESDRAFVFSAATGTYSLLGNIPDADNNLARLACGISADGQHVLGYGTDTSANGAFLWRRDSGVSLLPNTSNGSKWIMGATAISPNGRYLVGQSEDGSPLKGYSAVRWDRGVPAGAAVGFSLPRRAQDTTGIALTVSDDGTVGGYLSGGAQSPSGVWLPSGAFIPIRDHLISVYGMNLANVGIVSVTSISSDRRVLAGAGLSGGWLLTLPAPLDLATLSSDINVRPADTILGSSTLETFGSRKVNDGYNARTLVVQNLGSAPLGALSASFSGTDKDDFSIVYPDGAASFPNAVGINQYTSFEIRFAPRSIFTTSRTATLSITSNDPDQAAYTIALAGSATLPASQSAYFSYLSNRGVPADQRDFVDDPDGDGLSNLVEFAFALHPLTPSAGSSSLPRLQVANGTLSLAYRRGMTTSVDYVVETSTDLRTWTSFGVNQGTPDFLGFTTASVPHADGSSRFLRLKVTLKP